MNPHWSRFAYIFNAAGLMFSDLNATDQKAIRKSQTYVCLRDSFQTFLTVHKVNTADIGFVFIMLIGLLRFPLILDLSSCIFETT